MVDINKVLHQKPLKESQLVNLWLWDKHRESLQWRRVRLGPLPNKEGARLFLVTLRWADAIFVQGGRVTIVEAKLRPGGGAIGQLLQYRDLFSSTPEFSDFHHLPIDLILLAPIITLDIVEMASKHDIKYELFTEEDGRRVEAEIRKPVSPRSVS